MEFIFFFPDAALYICIFVYLCFQKNAKVIYGKQTINNDNL